MDTNTVMRRRPILMLLPSPISISKDMRPLQSLFTQREPPKVMSINTVERLHNLILLEAPTVCIRMAATSLNRGSHIVILHTPSPDLLRSCILSELLPPVLWRPGLRTYKRLRRHMLPIPMSLLQRRLVRSRTVGCDIVGVLVK